MAPPVPRSRRGSPRASGCRGSPRAAAPPPRSARRRCAGWWPPTPRYGAGRSSRSVSAASSAAARSRPGPLRSTPAYAVMIRCTSPRTSGSSSAGAGALGGLRGRRGARRGRRAARRPIRWAKTSPSSRELEASRFAPCTPVQATSPQAYRPGTEVRPVQVGADAAARVVGGRDDRDELGDRVDAVLLAGGEDRREPLRPDPRPEVAAVEVRAGRAGLLHPLHDLLGDDVARGEVGHRVRGRP